MKFSSLQHLKLAVHLRDNFICEYCGVDLREQYIKWLLGRVKRNHKRMPSATIDHVIPRSKGGEWNYENLVTSCNNCNNKKADKVQ